MTNGGSKPKTSSCAGLAVLGGVISETATNCWALTEVGQLRSRPLPKGRLKLPSVVWGEARF